MTDQKDAPDGPLLLGFTTVETREEAEKLAGEAVESGLAACIQVEAPVTSFFSWKGKQERATEYRLLFKFVASRNEELEDWIQRNHPYDTPEWVVLVADHTAEKYLQWAREVTK